MYASSAKRVREEARHVEAEEWLKGKLGHRQKEAAAFRKAWIEFDLVLREREISELRAQRDMVTYRLEHALRERDRLRRYLSALERGSGPEGVA